MSNSGNSRANENKKIRQEALRDQLSAKGLTQHVLEISEKLQDLTKELESGAVLRLKAAADLKLRLVSKYLPDLKSIEHSGEISTGDSSNIPDAEIIQRIADLRAKLSDGAAEQKPSEKVTH